MDLFNFNRRIAELCYGDLDVVNRVRQAVQRIAHVIDDLAQLVASLFSRRVGAKHANRGLQLVDAALKSGVGKRQCRSTQVVQDPLEFTRAKRDPEELYGEIRQLVCLVNDDGLCPGEKLDEALLFHREIGQQQAVVHDDEIRFLCGLAGLHDVAFRVFRAFLAKAVVRRRRDERPDRRVLGNVNELSLVTAAGAMAPLTDLVEIVHERVGGLCHLIEPVHAEVVRSALQKRRGHRPAHGFADKWQVAMIELVLQCLGAGADDRLSATLQGRNQVSKGLARTSTGFDNQPL